MKTFLLLISLCLISTLSAICKTNDGMSTKKYKVNIEVRKQDISGFAVIDFQSNKDMVGTIINDFGIKFCDFNYSRGKTRVMNVIALLNKWYIKKVLRKDLTFILLAVTDNLDTLSATKAHKAKRSVEISNNGDITLINHRHKIVYSLTPINNNYEVSE